MDYREILREVMRERIAVALYHTSDIPDAKERLEELIAFLVRIKNDTRWYSLSMPNVASLWDEIAEHELIFDFVMSGTSETLFRFSLLDNYSELQFVEQLADSLTATRRPREVSNKRNQETYNSVTPDEHITRGLTKSQWETCMLTDTWMMFLYLMFILSVDAGALIAEFTPPKRKTKKETVDG